MRMYSKTPFFKSVHPLFCIAKGRFSEVYRFSLPARNLCHQETEKACIAKAPFSGAAFMKMYIQSGVLAFRVYTTRRFGVYEPPKCIAKPHFSCSGQSPTDPLPDRKKGMYSKIPFFKCRIAQNVYTKCRIRLPRPCPGLKDGQLLLVVRSPSEPKRTQIPDLGLLKGRDLALV